MDEYLLLNMTLDRKTDRQIEHACTHTHVNTSTNILVGKTSSIPTKDKNKAKRLTISSTVNTVLEVFANAVRQEKTKARTMDRRNKTLHWLMT